MSFKQKGQKIGELVDLKQKAYGNAITKTNKLLEVFLEDYKNDDNTYTIPASLLKHIALQVRIMDKMNRIFSNPDGDLMQESPYNDVAGYGLLGSELLNESDN